MERLETDALKVKEINVNRLKELEETNFSQKYLEKLNSELD